MILRSFDLLRQIWILAKFEILKKKLKKKLPAASRPKNLKKKLKKKLPAGQKNVKKNSFEFFFKEKTFKKTLVSTKSCTAWVDLTLDP